MIEQQNITRTHNQPIRLWGRAPRPRFWQRVFDIIQHVCVIATIVLFLSYVQTVTATPVSQVGYSENGPGAHG